MLLLQFGKIILKEDVNMNNRNSLGGKLRDLRESKNITQTELAKNLNMTQGAYTRYENNARQPDYETLKKIANYFNVSIDYLLSNENDKTVEQEAILLKNEMDKMGIDLTNKKNFNMLVKFVENNKDLLVAMSEKNNKSH